MNNTLVMLPPLLPDMTLYSLTACAHRMAGRSRGSETCFALYGHHRAGLLHDFPSNVAEFCQRTNMVYGDAANLLRQATTLPYFTRFRRKDFEAEILSAMCGPDGRRLKFLLGLPASPSGASFPLRACPCCKLQDESDYGFAYWHRRHQLPGVAVCQLHAVRLRQSRFRIDRRRRSLFLLPGDPGLFLADPPRSLREDPLLQRLSALSADALDRPLPIECTAFHLQSTYLHGLRDRGLLTNRGRIRAQEFIRLIKIRYRSIAEYAPFDWLLSERHLEGLLRLVRKPRAEFHTVYHVLLIDALFGGWQEFVKVYEWQGSMEPAVDKATPPSVTVPTAEDPRFQLVAQHLRDGFGSLHALCRRFGLNYQTAIRHLAASHALGIAKRPSILTAELRSSVVAALRAGELQRDVARSFSLSRSTIDRICAETAGLHDEWANARFERRRERARREVARFLATDTTSGVSAACRRSGSYRWLMRNDGNWLKDQWLNHLNKQPVVGRRVLPRVDWIKRDAECLAALQQLASTGTPLVEQSERLQPAVILRKLPKLSFVPRLDRLPQCKEFVTELLGRCSSSRKLAAASP